MIMFRDVGRRLSVPSSGNWENRVKEDVTSWKVNSQ